MEMACLELGEDAVFLESRPTTGEAITLGKLEVIFGVASPVADRAPVPAIARMAPREMSVVLAEEPEDNLLLRAAESVRDSAPIRSAGRLEVSTQSLRLENPSAARRDTFAFVPGIIPFIGAPGVGKTTSIMKFALALATAKNAKVRIVEFEDLAVGRCPLLRRFTEIVNIPLTSQRRLKLEDLLPETPEEYILVDTPGLASGNPDAAHPLIRLLAQTAVSQCHLVVPGWFSPAATPSLLARSAPFRPTHVLLTHADDAPANGVQTLSSALRLPISLLTAGREAQRGFLSDKPAGMAAVAGRVA